MGEKVVSYLALADFLVYMTLIVTNFITAVLIIRIREKKIVNNIEGQRNKTASVVAATGWSRMLNENASGARIGS